MGMCKSVRFIVAIVLILATDRLTAQTPLLKFSFDETGTVVTNTGLVAANLTMKNLAPVPVATDLHGPSGSGVTGVAADTAFDNTAALTNGMRGGIAVSAATLPALAGLRSFTLTGWARGVSSPTPNLPRIIQWTSGGNNGFQLGYGTTLTLYVNGFPVSSGGLSYEAMTNANDWTFFAVSWDGTLGASNVKFYRGTSAALAAPVTLSLPQTIVTNTTAPFCVGNSSDQNRVLDGWLDDIRVYGSTSDSSGALSPFQVDYLRQQTFRPTNMTVYAVSGTYVNALTNVLDNDEGTHLANTGNSGVLLFDRYVATPFYDFGLTSRAAGPQAGVQGPPQSWRLEVQANDDPWATNGWTVLAAATNAFGAVDPMTVNFGRRVTFAPVTNRFFRWVNTHSGDQSGMASMDIGRPLYVYAWSTNTILACNYATDGKSNTFSAVGTSSGTNVGWIVLDVLRTNKNDHVTQVRLQHRIDTSSNIFPKDYTVSVSSTDDPANFDTVVAEGQLASPGSFGAGGDKGRWWTIEVGRQPKRFYRFAWTSGWIPDLPQIQIAEIAVTSINWVRKGTLTTLK